MTDQDDLDTLRALRRWADDPVTPTLGATSHDLAEYAGRDVDEVNADLDRYRLAGLLTFERNPMGSLYYSLSRDGMLVLAEADGVLLPSDELDLGVDADA